jgi:hypothetical protein
MTTLAEGTDQRTAYLRVVLYEEELSHSDTVLRGGGAVAGERRQYPRLNLWLALPVAL